jgi:hypothetical protein
MPQTFNCPSCGAPLQIEGDLSTIHCKYCNATVIVPPELRMPPALKPDDEPEFEASNSPKFDYSAIQQVAASQSKKRPYVWVFGLVFMILAVGLFFLFRIPAIQNSFNNTLAPLDAYPINAAVLANQSDGGAPDMVIPISDRADDHYYFILLDGITHKMVWKSPQLGENWTQAKAIVADTQIYMLDANDLTALDRKTGKVI